MRGGGVSGNLAFTCCCPLLPYWPRRHVGSAKAHRKYFTILWMIALALFLRDGPALCGAVSAQSFVTDSAVPLGMSALAHTCCPFHQFLKVLFEFSQLLADGHVLEVSWSSVSVCLSYVPLRHKFASQYRDKRSTTKVVSYEIEYHRQRLFWQQGLTVSSTLAGWLLRQNCFRRWRILLLFPAPTKEILASFFGMVCRFFANRRLDI